MSWSSWSECGEDCIRRRFRGEESVKEYCVEERDECDCKNTFDHKMAIMNVFSVNVDVEIVPSGEMNMEVVPSDQMTMEVVPNTEMKMEVF